MIQGKLLSFGDDLSEVFLIRKKVFIDELGMTEEHIKSDNDNSALHVVIYEESDKKYTVAAGSLYYCGESCLLDNIAVLKEYRNKKYGDFAVRMLIFKAFQKGYFQVELKCKKLVQSFFESIGFEMINEDNKDVKMIITEKNVCKECQKSK